MAWEARHFGDWRRRVGTQPLSAALALGLIAAVFCLSGNAETPDAHDIVANLDKEFQAAVKVNDAPTMERILGYDMTLVLGSGATSTRAELIQEARDKSYVYEKQEEDPGTQTVRVWGDTAVVTARLWVKGATGGQHFDRHLWFSDVYIRTAEGWRYVFGQTSLHLANDARENIDSR
jgi:ketosteroid isomerase-like protein